MKAKKLYIPVMLLAVVMALSCRDDNQGYRIDVPIGVSPLTSATKGAVSTIEDFQTRGTFGVYGYKATGTYSLVFADQEVVYNTIRTSAWGYTPLKYWDRSCYYYFGAYAPYFGTTTSETAPYLSHTGSSDSEDHILTVNNVPNWQYINATYWDATNSAAVSRTNSDAIDLQYAYSNDEAQDYLTSETPGYVNLTFSHALAWLEVQAAFPTMPDVYATKFYLTKLTIGNDTDCTAHDDCDVPAGSCQTPTSGLSTFSMNYTDSVTAKRGFTIGSSSYATLYPVSTGDEMLLTNEYQVLVSAFCVPFSVTGDGIYLNLSYRAVTEGSADVNYTVSVSIPKSSTESRLSFVEGHKYVVKLMFDKGYPLEQAQIYMTDWVTGSTTNYPVFNW